jgi:hypothetical protein
MSDQLIITSGDETIRVTLNGNEVGEKIREVAPFDSRVSKWGEEIYFAVPVEAEGSNPTDSVSVGDVAYWPEGSSMAIFYGPTPLSEGDEPVPPDDVEIIGEVDGPLDSLERIDPGDSLTLRVEES